jgi:hypothetical protein
MRLQLDNSNHNSDEDTRLAGACAEARTALAAIGAADAVVVSRALWQSITEQQSGSQPDGKRVPLWSMATLAKQAGVSLKAAYRLARKLPTVCVAPAHCCACVGGRGGL